MKTQLPTPEEETFFQMAALLENVAHYILAKKKINSPFYDSSDLMRFLNVSDKTLQRWRQHGKIPFKKVGRKYFYPKAFFDFEMKK